MARLLWCSALPVQREGYGAFKRQLEGEILGMKTPWGQADDVVEYDNGIKRVDTPSHGGYFVPTRLLTKIPPLHRSGSCAEHSEKVY